MDAAVLYWFNQRNKQKKHQSLVVYGLRKVIFILFYFISFEGEFNASFWMADQIQAEKLDTSDAAANVRNFTGRKHEVISDIQCQ